MVSTKLKTNTRGRGRPPRSANSPPPRSAHAGCGVASWAQRPCWLCRCITGRTAGPSLPTQRSARTAAPPCPMTGPASCRAAAACGSPPGVGVRPPGADLRPRVKVDDGVAQPARLVRNRHRAVPHRVQLVEAARLEAARHEQDVGRRGQAVAEGLVETDPRARTAVVLVFQAPHAVFQRLATRAETHQLDIVLLHQARRGLQQDIGALLRVKPADERDERNARVDRQPQLLLQRLLVQPLALLERRRIVVVLEVLVGARVPLVVVDAVGDAVEHGLALRKRALHAPPAQVRLDFFRVPGADRHNAVGRRDARLHEVHAAALLLVAALPQVRRVLVLNSLVPPARQHQLLELAWWEHALVAKVVDRQDRAPFGVRAVRAVLGGQVDRHQRRVPVVGHERAVLAVRRRRAVLGGAGQWHDERRLKARQAQQAEAEDIVAVGTVRVSVHAALAGVAGVVNEHEVNAFDALVEVPDLRVRANLLAHACVGRAFVRLVARRHNHDTVPARCQRRWQRVAHICEPARLGPRGDLRHGQLVHACTCGLGTCSAAALADAMLRIRGMRRALRVALVRECVEGEQEDMCSLLPSGCCVAASERPCMVCVGGGGGQGGLVGASLIHRAAIPLTSDVMKTTLSVLMLLPGESPPSTTTSVPLTDASPCGCSSSWNTTFGHAAAPACVGFKGGGTVHRQGWSPLACPTCEARASLSQRSHVVAWACAAVRGARARDAAAAAQATVDWGVSGRRLSTASRSGVPGLEQAPRCPVPTSPPAPSSGQPRTNSRRLHRRGRPPPPPNERRRSWRGSICRRQCHRPVRPRLPPLAPLSVLRHDGALLTRAWCAVRGSLLFGRGRVDGAPSRAPKQQAKGAVSAGCPARFRRAHLVTDGRKPVSVVRTLRPPRTRGVASGARASVKVRLLPERPAALNRLMPLGR
eukprot:355993-Chlamydomonas_euryale.AAC.21